MGRESVCIYGNETCLNGVARFGLSLVYVTCTFSGVVIED